MPADICVRIYGTQGNTKYFLRIFSYTKNTRNLKAKLHILRKFLKALAKKSQENVKLIL